MLIKLVCRVSLIVYLLHMHPIIKNVYTKYSLLDFINVDGISYFFDVTLIVAGIIIAGVLIGNCIILPLSTLLEQCMNKLIYRLKIVGNDK